MDELLPRRTILRAAFLGSVAYSSSTGFFTRTLHAMEPQGATEPELIVRNTRPLDAETPVELFDRFLTPNHLFFVRSHFGPPAVELHPWRLEVGGGVAKPLELKTEDLNTFEHVKLPAVLQCSGNGRSFFTPKIPGVDWERGAVGNAEWIGFRLKDLLERAGINPGSAHVHLLGADGPPSPKTPAFFRSIPLERALDPNTIIATRMNGEPLPLLHGGPMRLIVPGWAANHWIKWLRQITVSNVEAPGFYMQTGYRIPKVPAPPGANLKPADLKPVTEMNVKSLIARPSRASLLKPGSVVVTGVAWTGRGVVKTVELKIDDGEWKAAEFVSPAQAGTWRVWRYDWDARPGRHVLTARATDSNGETQPAITPWNRSGYLWNGLDQVACEVKDHA